MIVVTGSVTAQEDSFEEARQLSLEHVHRSRSEPGCISHAVHVDCENPLRLVFIEQWADRAALAAVGGALKIGQCIAELPYEFHIAMQHYTP